MDDLRQFLARPWYELLLIGIAPAGIIPLLQYWAVSPYGFPVLPVVATAWILAAPLLLGCVVSPWSLLQRQELQMRLFCALLLVATIVGFISGEHVRKLGFVHLAESSKPLIAAIQEYEKKVGEPPPTLEALVPDYLPEIPWTGLGAYPEYRYFTGPTAAQYDDNPWVLAVHASGGLLNFDQFLYFPKQNYPKTGHGGWLERIGDWAYLHE